MQQYTAVVYSTAVVLVASCLLTFIDPKRSFPLPGTRCCIREAAPTKRIAAGHESVIAAQLAGGEYRGSARRAASGGVVVGPGGLR